ncbi:MAG TPA: LytR C-terminal domain-containing protein [Exilispira sp.]|nr:LytR C-terminal domain-containing protein [Exilispira sp.]
MKILYSKLKTNLTLLDFYSLADKLEYLSINKIYYEIMPTKPLTIDNVSYLVPLTVQGGNYAQYLLKKVLTFLNEKEITYENAITVEVLNASPQKGLAKLVRDKLLQYGINVIYYGNSNNSSKVTRIIDRVGKLDKAEQIGAIMRCKNIETAINLNAGVDVTIIIGEDFNMSFFDN